MFSVVKFILSFAYTLAAFHPLAHHAGYLNFEEPDEASALLNIPSRRIETEFDTFLSNSFGFGGTNSSLIIRKFKENN